MSQKQVAGWLKGITLSIAGMGLLFFGLVVPYLAWDSLWVGHCGVLLRDSLSVLEGLRADRTRQFFFWRECKVVCGNQQAGVCAGGDLVCGNSVPRGKAGAWTGISDFYDSAHFYQCGDRGACGGAVPSDL